MIEQIVREQISIHRRKFKIHCTIIMRICVSNNIYENTFSSDNYVISFSSQFIFSLLWIDNIYEKLNDCVLNLSITHETFGSSFSTTG